MYKAGIDIGGTQLRAGIFDENYRLVSSYKTVNDPAKTGAENMDVLLEWLMQSGYPLAGIGIGSPGPLDLKKGLVLNPPNLTGWDNFAITAYTEEKTGLKTWLNNDANVAGYAEALLGAGKGFESVVFTGISTGLGGAYVYKGELISGAHSNAAEFYNMIVNDDTHHHKSANPGSLNETAGGSAMQRIASERYGRKVSTRELFDLYYAEDDTAKDILEFTSENLARGIANIFYTIDPDVIVMGGSVAIYHPWYIDKVKEKAMKYIVADDILIRPAQFDDDAGLLGAALLVRED